jgi:serine phosphatase RsbU (regulator of sigma subunit)
VADVQGKGLAAVQTAAVVLASFRESAYDAPDLAGIAEHIELSLGHQAPEGKFVTAIMAEVDREGAEVRLLNCGHPAPLLVSGGLARLAEPLEAALPLGLAGLATGDRKEYTVPFGPDDRLLFYTDGISEARDKSGAFYPLDRCGALLGGPDPDAALGRLYDDVLGHVGGRLHDDSAALFVMRPPPRPRQGNPSTTSASQ